MDEQYVGTVVSLTHTCEYDDCSVKGPRMEFLASRPTLPTAEAEVRGWISANARPDAIYAITIHYLNEFGDTIEAFHYETVMSIREIQGMDPR